MERLPEHSETGRRLGVRLALVAGCAFALAWSAPAGAAGPDTLRAPLAGAVWTDVAPGSIVRLRTHAEGGGFVRESSAFRRGVLLRASRDSVWLASAGDHGPVPIALAGVQRVEVFAGENRVAGALIGVALGALVGVSAGLFAADISGNSDEAFGTVFFAAAGIAVGAPIGGVIGGVRGLDRWKRVR